MSNSPATPEFSRIIRLDRLRGVDHHRLEAKEAERAAIAVRGDLVGINHLKAELTLEAEKDRTVHVTGRVVGEAVQTCVVTLEPVITKVDSEVDILLAPEDHKKLAALTDPDVGIDVEVVSRDEVDLGELVTQHFLLALPDYPRKAGAELPSSKNPAEEKLNPFAVLANLKEK